MLDLFFDPRHPMRSNILLTPVLFTFFCAVSFRNAAGQQSELLRVQSTAEGEKTENASSFPFPVRFVGFIQGSKGAVVLIEIEEKTLSLQAGKERVLELEGLEKPCTIRFDRLSLNAVEGTVDLAFSQNTYAIKRCEMSHD
jgi:hypothetical protein